jgi:hypothetical protein
MSADFSGSAAVRANPAHVMSLAAPPASVNRRSDGAGTVPFEKLARWQRDRATLRALTTLMRVRRLFERTGAVVD